LPEALTVRGEGVVLLSVHRIPFPPLPGEAEILFEPHAVPPPPIVGALGTALMVTDTPFELLAQPAAEVVTA
jgi:hypothetical protein